MVRVFFLILLLTASCAWSQSLRPEQMMILLIGASAQKTDPDQAAVLAQLKALRQQPAFKQLKIGTMHFDRPAEARFATQVLGVDRGQLPCLCLVQLDSKLQRPLRKLYSMPRITRKQLDLVESMGKVWNQTAGLSAFAATVLSRRLVPGQSLKINQSVNSTNGRYHFVLQDDGNVVLYNQDRSIWASETSGRGGTLLRFTDRGLLQLCNPGGEVIWQTPGAGSKGNYFFEMQEDGNAVIYMNNPGQQRPVWATETAEK